jgi:GNAT superfamily N-acetyltransferase
MLSPPCAAFLRRHRKVTIRIRPATPSDLTGIKLLLREFGEYLNAIDDPEPILDDEINRIEQLAFGSTAVCTILVAEADGAVAGLLCHSWGLAMEGVAPALFVGNVYIRDSHRGQGMGRMLMEHVREIARARGASQVIWTVWRKNLAAQAFYKQLGASNYESEILMCWPVSTVGLKEEL